MSRKRDIRNQHGLNPTKQQLCNGRIAIHLHNMSQEFLSIIPLHKNYDYPEYLPVISGLQVQMSTYIVILDNFSVPFINGNCCNTLFIQIRKVKILTKALSVIHADVEPFFFAIAFTQINISLPTRISGLAYPLVPQSPVRTSILAILPCINGETMVAKFKTFTRFDILLCSIGQIPIPF